jgi:hypothetical protein
MEGDSAVKRPLHLICLLATGLSLGLWAAASAGEGKGGTHHSSPPSSTPKPDRTPASSPKPDRTPAFVGGGSTAEGHADSEANNDYYVTKLVDLEGTVSLDSFTEPQLNRRLAHLKEGYLKALAEWEDAQKLAQAAGQTYDEPKPAKPDYKFVKVKGWKNAQELLTKLRRQQEEEDFKKRKEEAAKSDAPKGDAPKTDPPKETAAAVKTDTSKEGDAIVDRIQKVLDTAAPTPKP